MDLTEAKRIIRAAWPAIVEESRAVLGGELHYQAVVYHCLRNAGCPRTQIGMNVKQWIADPVTDLFKSWDVKKHTNFQGGFEPIPDIVLFGSGIGGDWRRRNYASTLDHMLCAIEVKASERAKSRLSPGEVRRDIAKLAAHRDEVIHRGGAMYPVMMVIDVAHFPEERMRDYAITQCAEFAVKQGVAWLYVSHVIDQCMLMPNT
jgi:hypothetical protein